MKKIIPLLLLSLSVYTSSFSQQAELIISQVRAKQKLISTVSYQINRTDTLGAYIRHMKGKVLIERNNTDTIFGFKFWAKKTNDPIEKIYDGHIAYVLDTASKTYEISTTPSGFHNLLNGGGGHMVVPDLLNLKIEGMSGVSLVEDRNTYLLTFKYPNIDQYNITDKFKAIRIDKKTMLPLSVREHQESLGRIQDLYYEISNTIVNAKNNNYNFSEPAFLKNYRHIVPVRKPSPILSFLGNALPDFTVQTFINGDKQVSTSDFKDSIVLLDFWEVWCGPCIESMPKIEELYQKYKNKGLRVYGIVNDPINIKSSKELVSTKGFTLPMLMGSEQLRNLLKITGIPLYVLIDKSGKVAFISEGYSADIEANVIKALGK